MADVRDRRRAGDQKRDRAQLILVTGLAVAVTLVALVLLLNTVIYTQNLATRGAGVEDGEAVSFRQEVVEGVGDVMDAENREEYDEAGKVEQNVTDGVSRYDKLVTRHYAESATVADVEEDSLSLTDGYLLRQTNSSRNFTAAGDATGDWTLAEDVDNGDRPGVRNATFTVSRENLSDGQESSFSVRLVGDTDADGDGDNDRWQVYVYDHSGAVTLAVKNGTESVETGVCSMPGPEATIDLTAGTINGSACPELVWAKGISTPYDVEFGNTSEVTGTYSLTVATPAGSATNVNDGNFAEANTEESPRAVHAIYAAEFDAHFQTTNLEFHTTLRVAPGEPE